MESNNQEYQSDPTILSPGPASSAPAPETPPAPEPETPAQLAEKNLKKFTILSIVLGAAAVIFLGLGIWGLISAVSSNDKAKTLSADLANKNAIIDKIAKDTGQTITNPEEVPAYAAVSGYIYITEWGIKIKIPSDLTSVSYILDQKYRPSICFNAVQEGVKYFPAFADIAKNPGGMGCLVRVATHEGNTNKDTGASFGTKVFTDGGYNYFYKAPSKSYSTDAAEQGLENTAVQLIKNMLSENVSHFE